MARYVRHTMPHRNTLRAALLPLPPTARKKFANRRGGGTLLAGTQLLQVSGRSSRDTACYAANGRATKRASILKFSGIDSDCLNIDARSRCSVKPLNGPWTLCRSMREGWLRLGIAKGVQWNRAALGQLHAGNCPNDLRDFMRGVLKALRVK